MAKKRATTRAKKAGVITEDDLLIYGSYQEVAASLQYSNNCQLNYRMLTFTWLLATFIGIGYTLSSVEVNLPFHPLIIVVILSIASLLVIGIIWYLDLIVQEKNIASAVNAGLRLEERTAWLPKAYTNVVELSELFSYVKQKSYFYLGAACLLVVTASASLTFYFYVQSYMFWPAVIIGTVLFVYILLVLNNRAIESTDPYKVIDQNGDSA